VSPKLIPLVFARTGTIRQTGKDGSYVQKSGRADKAKEEETHDAS